MLRLFDIKNDLKVMLTLRAIMCSLLVISCLAKEKWESFLRGMGVLLDTLVLLK